MEDSDQNKQKSSIKRRVLIFSVLLFLLIFIGGVIIFVISYNSVIQVNTGHELKKTIEIERIKLEASVNGQIALALKMATSPVIIKHFLDPDEAALRRIAFDEIEGYRQAFASGMVFWASDIDKEFYFSETNHYTIDTDNKDNYWYKMTLYETEKYNFNINYNPEIQKTMLWINAPVFDTNRTPIGLVGTGIDLTEFVNSIFRNYASNSSLYLFNSDGEITGAKNSSLVAEKVKIDYELVETGAEIFQKVKTLSPGEYQYYNSHDGVVAIGQVSALGWYITAIEKVGLFAVFGSNMTFLFFAMIAVIAGIFIIFNFYISQMIQPLNSMKETLDHIAVDWDLTQRLHLHRHDEIGTLGEFFNLTFGKMRELLVAIKGKTIALSDTGDELSSYMTATKKDIDGINNNIQDMRGEILSQSDMVISSVSSMEKINNGIEELNKHIAIQSESVAQSSSAIEEMLANIRSVTQTLVKNTANINTLAETSEAGRVDVQKVSTDIHEIAAESESLMQINSVMQTIASQTNLLAMNAAIEAAHAGSAGAGFAVVADEIRKLAENSGKQSKTISAVLKKIKLMIDDITKSTGVVLERFDVIEQDVQTVSDQESQIRNAMEEQGVGSRQILDAVNKLNTVTGEVRNASLNMTAESKEVLKQSETLKKNTAVVAGNMDDMSGSADEITKAFKRVQEITQENKENITMLSTDISLFKVE